MCQCQRLHIVLQKRRVRDCTLCQSSEHRSCLIFVSLYIIYDVREFVSLYKQVMWYRLMYIGVEIIAANKHVCNVREFVD